MTRTHRSHPRVVGLARAALLLAAGLLVSCQVGPPLQPEPKPPEALARHVIERFSVLICLPPEQARTLLKKHRVTADSGFSLSSATPVSADGWFLTSAHSVTSMREGDACLIFYSLGGNARNGLARLGWIDERADLALVQAPFATPQFYEWTPRDRPLPKELPVVHGGLATGPRGEQGRLLENVPGWGRGRRPFLHSLRLEPGDSGGPLLTLAGDLVGINQAVGYVGVMDTRFFTESRAVRPDPATLARRLRPPATPTSTSTSTP